MTRTRDSDDPTIVRGYRNGDEDGIRDLFRRSFHRELAEAEWRWRYVENPLGSRRITVATFGDGRIAGHYGGYPVAFAGPTADAHGLLAHQIGDVMTDPAARRLGRGSASLVARMAKHFWDTYGEGHVDLHYGFNTGTARELQTRVIPGVRPLEPVTTWTRARLPRWFGRIFRRTTLTAERAPRFEDEWDAFAARVRPAYGLAGRRDSAYLNWRYRTASPHGYLIVLVRDRGRLVGASVFRADGGTLRWGDALFDPECPDAVRAAIEHAQQHVSCRRVSAWFSPRPQWWVERLEDLGFRQAPELNGLTLVYAPFTDAAVRLMPSLHYSWGDSDLF